MAHKYVTSLRVVDQDGVDKAGTIGSNIVLQAGVNIAVSVNEDNEIELTAGSELGTDNPSTLQKFTDIIEGSSSFSGVPYYIATIKNTNTVDGAFFLNVDRCYHLGQFLDFETPEDIVNLLKILDTCPACIDCPEYNDFYTHINTVKNAIDGEKDTIGNPKGVLDQYTALVERWNYVVHLKSWRFNAEATGSEVHASCKYTNHTSTAIPAGLTMSMDFIGVPDPSRAFVIDTAVKGTITRAGLYTYSGSVGGGGGPSESSSSSDDRTVYLETLVPLEPGDGIRFYGGSLSPDYIGEDNRVSISFELTVPSGGIGDQSDTFITNNMVVVEQWVT